MASSTGLQEVSLERLTHDVNNPAQIGPYRCGADEPLLVIAGPCVIESEALTLAIAEQLARDTRELPVQLVFKASFDKANRTSVDAYRGPGLDEGLRILERVRDDDRAAGDDRHPRARSGRGRRAKSASCCRFPPFSPGRPTCSWRPRRPAGRCTSRRASSSPRATCGTSSTSSPPPAATNMLLCERGTFFGYGRLVNDMRAIPQMQSLGVPVVFDATHSVQEPGGLGGATGGNRAMVEPLARAAMALGVDGLFCETHPDPDRSPSDGPNMVPLDEFADMLRRLVEIRDTVAAVRTGRPQSLSDTGARRRETHSAIRTSNRPDRSARCALRGRSGIGCRPPTARRATKKPTASRAAAVRAATTAATCSSPRSSSSCAICPRTSTPS